MIFNDPETLAAFDAVSRTPAAHRVIEALETRRTEQMEKAINARTDGQWQKTAGRAQELGDILQMFREAGAQLRHAPRGRQTGNQPGAT